jgi:hypothetical protein
MRAASAIRSGFATAGCLLAFSAFSSWSPRSSRATRPPSVPSTTSVLSRRDAGSERSFATSAIVRAPGVATSRIGAEAPRGLARRQRLGELEVGRVAVAVREHDRVLAGVGEDVELLRGAAADRAGVGMHRAEAQAQPREDGAVGVVHPAIAAASEASST